MVSLLCEYRERKTLESRVAKDADQLDQMVLQREYFQHDPQNAVIWHSHASKPLETKSAKKLAQKISKTNPLEWLYVIAEQKTKTPIKR